MSNHPVRQALCKSFTSLLDWPTLVAVLLGGAIALGVHRAPSDLASTVFTANATFVALIVPAAALANTLLEGRLISYVEQLSKLATSTGAAKEGAGKAATTLSELADRVVGATAPVVRGFVFLLVSFGLSIGALFHPNHHIWRGAGSFKVRPADLLIGEALGFDVVGILLFLPFVWLLLDKSLADDTVKLIKAFADSLNKANSPATQAQAAPRADQAGAGGSTG